MEQAGLLHVMVELLQVMVELLQVVMEQVGLVEGVVLSELTGTEVEQGQVKSHCGLPVPMRAKCRAPWGEGMQRARSCGGSAGSSEWVRGCRACAPCSCGKGGFQ